MNILCLYWKGEFRNRDFTVNDVERLRQTVDKHIDRPYTFYCLTNDMEADLPAEKIPLKHNWPGWWSKIELHRDDLPGGRTLYLDLDTHVVGSLAPVLDYPGDLVMFNNRAKIGGKRKVVLRYQAAIMLFTPGSTIGVYERFSKDPEKYMKEYRSDQDIMGDWIPHQPTFPDHWMVKLSTLKSNRWLHPETIFVTGQSKGESFRNPKFATWLDARARGKEEMSCM